MVVVLFAASWFLRRDAATAPGTLPFVLSLIGVALALMAAWLGGELVVRLGVGVDRGALSNAPSSLAGQPASQGALESRGNR